jgi:Flp pilus assembly protein TadB
MFRAFLQHVQSPRRVDRQSALAAAFYAFEAVVCAAIVTGLYTYLQPGSAMWAVVSAVLVLQPGWEQSYGASATRFASNLIGALPGAIVDKLHGHGAVDAMAACSWRGLQRASVAPRVVSGTGLFCLGRTRGPSPLLCRRASGLR